jgi:hypothetical protein
VADLALELDAIVARRDGDPDTALQLLLRASYWEQTSDWPGFPEGSFLSGRQADSEPGFLRAELLRESGRDAEAALWYRVAADGIWHRAAALRELGKIRERQGEAEEARALARRVAVLWSEADPDS